MLSPCRCQCQRGSNPIRYCLVAAAGQRYKVLAEIFELSTYFAALGNKKNLTSTPWRSGMKLHAALCL